MPRDVPPKLKESIMVFGLLLTGVVEFVEGCDSGLHPIKAGKRAYERTKVRAEVIKDGMKARERARVKR